MVIDHGAFLFLPAWLQTGWSLWEQFGSGRDYFMGLPTPDLMVMRQIEAKYAHWVAMDRALPMQLKSSSGDTLLQHSVACEFWTLHSDRASLPSLAACLSEVPPGWIEDLGRWSKSMSATYVRTHLARVSSIQRWVAEAARGHTRLDEEELWSDFAVFLMKHGLSTEAAVGQIVTLTKEVSTSRAAYRVLAEVPASGNDITVVAPMECEAQALDEGEAPAPLTPTHTVPDDRPSMGDSWCHCGAMSAGCIGSETATRCRELITKITGRLGRTGRHVSAMTRLANGVLRMRRA